MDKQTKSLYTYNIRRNFALLVGILILLFVANSCDQGSLIGSKRVSQTNISHKNTSINNPQSFFSHPDSTASIIVSVINKLKKNNKKENFIKKFIENRGYPVWRAASVFPQHGGLTLLIPVVRFQKKAVTGILDIFLNQPFDSPKLSTNSSKNNRFYFHWIKRGSSLKGKDRPNKRILEIFMLGFEKEIFGKVQTPGIVVKNKYPKSSKKGHSKISTSKNDTLEIPHIASGHWVHARIPGSRVCTSIIIYPNRSPWNNHDPYRDGPRTSAEWHCTYQYEWVYIPGPNDGRRHHHHNHENGTPGDNRGNNNSQTQAQKLQNYLKKHPFALLKHVPCEQITKWRSLLHHKIPKRVRKALKHLRPHHMKPSRTGLGGEIVYGAPYIQKFLNASGNVVSMDMFSVTVPANKIPHGWSASQYLNHIRKILTII